MYDRRASGILLHPTSLPGPGGIGDLGDGAVRFVDWLAAARQRRWQIMPLGPTGYGDSPYAGLSALAGNPLLISLERLVDEGILDTGSLADVPSAPPGHVDYGAVAPWKLGVLERAYRTFVERGRRPAKASFATFAKAHASWLDTYALFAALKEAHGGAPWTDWQPDVARRAPAALAEWSTRLADRVGFQRFLQWTFFRQWTELKGYANSRDIEIIGDIPIFVAHDSADVWANPEVFSLDADGHPTVVAGVPPDYFSPTGQRWGNPLYRWDVLAGRGFDWWIERFRMTLTMVDIVRIDHFRGFAAAWEIPAGEATAVKGRWVPGPGAALFEAVRDRLGASPIIAEDLGVITPDVEALRTGLGFPGMSVLQFAWGGDAANLYLPHNHARDQVIYTGTHDNDTTVGWWRTLDEATRAHAGAYLDVDDASAKAPADAIAWAFIRSALMSPAETAIIPMQDVLGLGTEARMNLPGRPMGNWGWRLTDGQLDDALASRLARLTGLYGRERLAVGVHRDMV
jgi:4-alpha-glucanotransferase